MAPPSPLGLGGAILGHVDNMNTENDIHNMNTENIE